MRRVSTTLQTCLALALATASGCSGTESTAARPSVLFVADVGRGAIASFPELDPASGTAPTGRVISGIPSLGTTLAYDAATDSLYASAGSAILVYASASLAAGTPTPVRTIVPSGLSATGSWMLFLDAANDRIYFGGSRTYDGCIVVIENASTANGTVQPSRTMTISEGVRHFAVDTDRSILYVVNSLMGVHVYEDADTASGSLTAARHLFTSRIPKSVAVDRGRDRLYAAGNLYAPEFSDGVLFVNAASAATYETPYGAVVIPGATFVTSDAAHDRVYVGAGVVAWVIDSASALTDGAFPTGAVSGMAPAGSTIAGFAFP